jgi:hypothetical protein
MKPILLILYLFLSTFFSNAQSSYIKSRWNFKSGISIYPQRSDHDPKPINLRIEANYGVWGVLEAGAYLGIGRYTYWLPLENNSRMANNTFSPFYGIQTNFHLIPLLIKKNDFRFDFYLSGKFGGNYLSIPDGSDPKPGHHIEYGLSCGLAYYIWKHTGVYTEYSIGRYSYYTLPLGFGFENGLKSNLRFGITYKYKKTPKK